MSRPHPKITVSHIRRPTLETKFHVDFGWWEKSNLDMKAYLLSRLNLGDQGALDMGVEFVDVVDPETGEVRRLDGFQYALQTYFAQLPDGFARHTSLVDAIFYVLLANGNRPMSSIELAEWVEREPEVVLRTIGGPRIYQGIRPLFEEDE